MKELIDEMSYDLAECHVDYLDDAKLYTDYDTMAQKMVSRGYRKQREGAWKRSARGKYDYFCTACGEKAVQGIYGNHDRLFKFCHNCGAKMKGADDD